MKKKLLSIGKILNFHGINGEVKVGFSEGKEDQISALKQVYATKIDSPEPVMLNVEKIRFHKKVAIIKFKEINSINDTIEYKGSFLKLDKDKLTEYLDKDEFYIDDLIGSDVFDTENNLVGKVVSIVNSAGRDLLVINVSEGNDKLVPFVKDLVPEVDLKEKKVIVNNIPGLLDNTGEVAQ